MTIEDQQTRVSRITVARLHNCGNYEHVRYEISVDVGANDNPARVAEEVEALLEDLKPLRTDYDYELTRARNVLAKPAIELSELELSNLPAYRERVRKVDEAIANRQRGYRRLEALGGSALHTDHKEQWEEEGRY